MSIEQAEQDRENLRYLAIFHYVVAGITALMGCFPFIHLTVGIMLLTNGFPQPPNAKNAGPPPEWIGALFVAFALFLIVVMWSMAVLCVMAANRLRARRHHSFCFIVACLMCIQMPFGTVLGVFTILVLNRPSVRRLFEASRDETDAEHR